MTAEKETRMTATTTAGAPETKKVLTPLEQLAANWGARIVVEKPRPGKPVSISKKKVRPAKATSEPVSTEAVQPEAKPEATLTGKQKVLAGIAVGQTIKLPVSHVPKEGYGAFLKVGGGVFALLHFTCVPGDNDAQRQAFIKALKYKQELTVTVLSVDHAKKHIGVTLVAEAKADFIRNLKVGQVLPACSVVSNRDTGARVSLGLKTAFMHVSEVEGAQREQRDANLAAMKPGTKVDVVVIFVDAQTQSVKVSQRLLPLTKFTVGEEVTGTIVRLDKGTVVLKLENGAKGLVPRSLLAGDADEKAATVIGGSFTATVHSVDFNPEQAVVVLTRKGK
jgi:ribosomal protein S1